MVRGQRCSAGWSSGEYGGRKSKCTCSGTRNRRLACQPARCVRGGALLGPRPVALRPGRGRSCERACSFETARLSRLDLHADWQGGWRPSAELGSALRFIKPARVKWHAYHDGGRFTGFVFGSGAVVARIYDKGWQARQRSDDSYAALLKERCPDRFDPEAATWRLEFQLRREGATGFRLYAEPEADDDEAIIDAELAAEELPHIGTLPRFFRHESALWRHLTTHWLRLAVDDGGANRSRWPAHPTWATLSQGYEPAAEVEPPAEESYELVRGARYTGKSRVLRRMLLGVVDSLEVQDEGGLAGLPLGSMGRHHRRARGGTGRAAQGTL